VESISSGGFPLDIDFSATRLRELSKMDGAIVLDRDVNRILRANTQLVPDPRDRDQRVRHAAPHRRAGAKQTGFPVISVSQSMRIIALYIAGRRVVLEDSSAILSRANQALQTLERYKSRLDEVTGTLSALEIEDLVTVRDVANVLQRLEMVRRIKDEIAEYVVQPRHRRPPAQPPARGAHRRLSDDLESGHPRLPARGQGRLHARGAIANLRELSSADLLDLGAGARAVGFAIVGDALDSAVSPARLPPADQGAAASSGDRRPAGRPLRVVAAAARGQPGGPHERGRCGREPCPRRARGPFSAGGVEHPRAVRLTGWCTRSLPAARPPRPRERLVRVERAAAAVAPSGHVGVGGPCLRGDVAPDAGGAGGAGLARLAGPLAHPADLAAEAPGRRCAPGAARLPRAALRLHEAAAAIVDRHGGEVPAPRRSCARCRDRRLHARPRGLLRLRPPTVVVDTNVRRVLVRTLLGEAQPRRR
jgi:hypothetical protein